MKREEEQLDAVFRDAALDYGADPPASVWERVSSGLDAHVRSIRMLWIQRSAVAATVLLAFFIGYFMPGKPTEQLSTTRNILPFSHVLPKAPGIVQASNDFATISEPRNSMGTISSADRTQASGEGRATVDRIERRQASLTYAKSEARFASYLYLRKSEAGLVRPEELAVDGRNNEKSSIWRMGAEASPMYAYRAIDNEPADNAFLSQPMAVDLDSEEKPSMGYSAGLNASASLGKRFSIQSGVYFARQGQYTTNFRVSSKAGATAKAFTSAGMVVFNQTGAELINRKSVYFDNQNVEGSDLIQQFDFLELPLVARYKLIDRNLDVLAFAGLSSGLLIGNNVLIEDEGGIRSKVGYTYGTRKFTVNSQAGVAVEIPLSQRLNLSVSPGLRYALTPLNELSAVEHRPYSFMLSSSLNFDF